MLAPGPTPRDMLRAVPRIRRDAPGFLADCAARHGDVVQFPLPTSVALSVNDPAAARRVLQDNHRGYDKGTVQYRTLSVVTGNGLLTSDGELWRRQRRLVQPAFHSRTLAAVGERTAEAAARQLDRWAAVPDGEVVDVDAAMMHTTLDVVGHALFSTDLGASSDTLVASVLAALDAVVARARSPLPLPLTWPTPGNARMRRAITTLDRAVLAMVDARRESYRRSEQSRGDLLDLLLAARDEGAGEGMDDRQLRDEIITLVIAGHETVASALSWAFHLLAGADEARERLRAEAVGVLGEGARRRSPSVADLPRLPWARAVLEETLRLYPPAWVVSRRSLADDELAGVRVPAGALVLVSPWVLQRDGRSWPDPLRFDPARFLPGAPEPPRGAYLPFGAGPRLCVGREFALVEGTLLLASFAAAAELTRPPGAAPVEPDALVTVRPRGGLPLVLHRG
ncbi:MAG TPA: cytochrome P450 [Motilibacteraceae bacterium]|nr:cytochrome P450 [Motilibacteraceae bacterium]